MFRYCLGICAFRTTKSMKNEWDPAALSKKIAVEKNLQRQLKARADNIDELRFEQEQ
jgi:hypothetical protein